MNASHTRNAIALVLILTVANLGASFLALRAVHDLTQRVICVEKVPAR